MNYVSTELHVSVIKQARIIQKQASGLYKQRLFIHSRVSELSKITVIVSFGYYLKSVSMAA